MDFQNNWREEALGFNNKIMHTLKSSFMTDLTIKIINEGVTEFKVHAVIFGMWSEVFEKMCTSNLKEGSSRIIEIKNVKADIFHLLLRFIYGNKLQLIDMQQACELFIIADQYLIKELKDICHEYIFKNVDSSTVCMCLQMARYYNLEQIKAKSLKIIQGSTRDVLTHSNFLEAGAETVQLILEQNRLSVREIQLFRAVQVWIEATVAKKGEEIKESICNLLLPKIHYLSMSSQEFTNGPVSSNLLKNDVIVSIYAQLCLRKGRVPMPEGFTTFKRINLFEVRTEILTPVICKTDGWRKIFFSVLKDFSICEIKFYSKEGNEDEKYHEEIDIKIKDEDSGDWDSETHFTGEVNYSTTVVVEISEPLELRKNKKYVLEICSTGGYRKNVDVDRKKLFNKGATVNFERFAFWSSHLPINSITFQK